MEKEGYKGPERRRFKRISEPFVVYYKVSKENSTDISQVKNISEGGMMFTAGRPFLPGTILSLNLKSQLKPEGLELSARVIESKEKVRDLIYETRVAFVEMRTEYKILIAQLVDLFRPKLENEEKGWKI